MNFLSKIIFAGAVLFLSTGLVEAGDGRSPTVVELYTSQGCSSCPPADALLGEFAKRKDVLALSFHVDYWDYIGWKDPFAAPINSARQQEYSRIFKKSYVYTPQIVIHGLTETTGSNKAAIAASIKHAKLAPDVAIKLERQPSGDLKIRVARGRQPGQGCAVFLQSAQKGPILGAAYVQLAGVLN